MPYSLVTEKVLQNKLSKEKQR